MNKIQKAKAFAAELEILEKDNSEYAALEMLKEEWGISHDNAMEYLFIASELKEENNGNKH